MSNSEKGACLPTILGATAGGHPHAPLHPHFVGEPLGKEAASSISSKQESKEDAPEKGSNSTKTPVVAVAPDNAKRQIEQAQPQGPAPLMLPIPARKVPPPRVVPEWELTSIAAAKAANEAIRSALDPETTAIEKSPAKEAEAVPVVGQVRKRKQAVGRVPQQKAAGQRSRSGRNYLFWTLAAVQTGFGLLGMVLALKASSGLVKGQKQ